MKEQNVNPDEYGYTGGEQIIITPQELLDIRHIVDVALASETNAHFPEKYKYLNKDTKEPIKTVTDKNRHLAMKVVDIEATMSSNPVIQRTELGMELLKLRMTLGGIHLRAIDEGVAKHIPTLQAEQKEEVSE